MARPHDEVLLALGGGVTEAASPSSLYAVVDGGGVRMKKKVEVEEFVSMVAVDVLSRPIVVLPMLIRCFVLLFVCLIVTEEESEERLK